MAATERRPCVPRAIDVAIVALVAVVSTPSTELEAQPRAAASVAVHTDSDRLTVVHPQVSARVPIDDATRVAARWEADVITAATIDVRASASPAGFDETRHGIGANIERDLSRSTTASAGASLDLSPDYDAIAVTLQAAWQDVLRIRRFSVSTTCARSVISRAGDARPTGDLVSTGASMTYATLLSRSAVLDLALGIDQQSGYLESPYRFVPVRGSGLDQRVVHVPEVVPDARLRAGFRAGARWSITRSLVLRSSARVHGDSWGVLGVTADLELWLLASDGVRVLVGSRVYAQDSARFYEGRYSTLPDLPRFRTLDRELAASTHTAASAGLDVALGRVAGALVRIGARAEGAWTRYADTPRLPERFSLTAATTLSVER